MYLRKYINKKTKEIFEATPFLKTNERQILEYIYNNNGSCSLRDDNTLDIITVENKPIIKDEHVVIEESECRYHVNFGDIILRNIYKEGVYAFKVCTQEELRNEYSIKIWEK